jgi:drug/metabolite transporter (DMT)-like permease
VALQYIDPFELSLLRTFIGALFLLLIAAALKKLTIPKNIWLVMILGFLQNSLLMIFYNIALVRGGAGKVVLLIYSMPFWTIFFSVLFFKERLSLLQKISFVLALSGLIFILRPWSSNSDLLSYIAAILGGLSWAAANIVAIFIWRRGEKIEGITLSFWQMLFGFLGVFVFMFFVKVSRPMEVNTTLILALFFIGVLATGFAWFLWLYLLKNISPSVVGLTSLLVPIFSILEAWYHLGEVPEKYEVIGISLILTALLMLYLNSLKRLKKTKK